jgi:hypothetical protein
VLAEVFGERRIAPSIELGAVGLERPRVTLACGHLALEALEPPAGDGVEAKAR